MKNIKILIALFVSTLTIFFIGLSMTLASGIEIENYVNNKNENKIQVVICATPTSYNTDVLKSKNIFYLNNSMQLFNQGWVALIKLNIYEIHNNKLTLVEKNTMNTLKTGTMLIQLITPIMMFVVLGWNYKKIYKFLNKHAKVKKKNIEFVKAKPKIITKQKLKEKTKEIFKKSYPKINKAHNLIQPSPKIEKKLIVKPKLNFNKPSRTIGKLNSKLQNDNVQEFKEIKEKPTIKFEKVPKMEVKYTPKPKVKETIIDPNDILRKDLSSHNPGDYITYKGLQYKLIKIEPATYKDDNVWKATSKNLKNNDITVIYFTK